MRKMKQLASLLLALVMVLSVGVTARADDTYTITINNSTEGYEYTAYQIFAGDLADDGTLSNIVWGDNITESTALYAELAGITTTDATSGDTVYPFKDANDDNLTSATDVAAALAGYDDDSTVAQAFAEVISNYITDSGTNSQYNNTNKNYTIGGLNAGYYLVKNTSVPTTNSSAYTRYILWVTSSVAVEPKSDIPTVEKKVYEEDYTSSDSYYGEGYNDVADYDIGDDVPFELIGTLPDNLSDYSTYKYIFHDTMDSGLTFKNATVNVKVVTGTTVTTVPATYNNGTDDVTNYTVVTGTSLSDSCTFEVRFEDILSLSDGTNNIEVTSTSKIYVYFTATLNEDAVIGLSGNENEVYLEYSNNPNAGGEGDTGTTPEDKVIVFTYELDVTKADGKNAATSTKLKDAEFVLYKLVADEVEAGQEQTYTTYYVVVDSDGKVTGWTTYLEASASEPTGTVYASVLKSDDNGDFSVIGLDDGTYYLEETKAPTGYNKLEDPITLVIAATTANGQSWSGTAAEALTALTISVDGETPTSGSVSDGTVSTTVVNSKGSALPSTGGIGTTIFYIVGTVMVLGAAVVLITRRRMANVK